MWGLIYRAVQPWTAAARFPHTRGGANLNKTPSVVKQRVFCLYAHESAGYLQVLLPFQVNSIMAQDPVHKVLPGQ
mgnify:CR=1 FL=1